MSIHALIVTCVFPPEPVVSSQTSAQLAQVLVEDKGYTVTVITTFPNRPAGKLYPGYKRKLFDHQEISKRYKIIRCFSFLSSESHMISRFLENISFGLFSALAVLLTKNVDVIYANTWPVFASALLYVVAKLRRIPLVISIQDVYPESIVSQDRFHSTHPLIRGMRWLDGVIARGSRAIITISERFTDIYRESRCVSAERVHMIPNWVEGGLIDTNAQFDLFRRGKGIPTTAFVVAYGGNIGAASGIETVVEAFGYLTGIENLYLLIGGAGSRLKVCQAQAKRIGGTQIVFHSPWATEETSSFLRAANVLILPTQGDQSLVSVPSKLLAYMLSARPIIALARPNSDLANLIEQAGCGWVVEPDQPEQLADIIKALTGLEPSELAARGEAGRAFVLKNLTQEVCLPKVIKILETAVQQEKSYANTRNSPF